MGKKRSVSIRRIAEKLIESCPNSFASDFETNKELISEMITLPSKKLRNQISGYITSQYK